MDTGRQVNRTILTTHDDPARAVAAGVAALLHDEQLDSRQLTRAVHATTLFRDDSGGDLLAFDMGGTTAKLSLVDGGEPLTAYSFEAARQKRFVEGSGLPIRISTIELIEIGAGGGSIARVDEERSVADMNGV